ncbi:hypothetical protein BC827DRAFT_560367 [Russula dissimulans]|nr:hypothetical protein BC827DRAFT_560367 [Russula dissimulans]
MIFDKARLESSTTVREDLQCDTTSPDCRRTCRGTTASVMLGSSNVSLHTISHCSSGSRSGCVRLSFCCCCSSCGEGCLGPRGPLGRLPVVLRRWSISSSNCSGRRNRQRGCTCQRERHPRYALILCALRRPPMPTYLPINPPPGVLGVASPFSLPTVALVPVFVPFPCPSLAHSSSA